MQAIKSLIIATALASALSPVASLCAREMDIDSDNERESIPMDIDSDNEQDTAAAAQAMPMAPEEVAEAARIEQFVAQKAEYVFPFLPVNCLIKIILEYTKPAENEITQANNNLLRAQGLDDLQGAITALNEGAYVDVRNRLNNLTSLQNTAMYGQVELVKILLKYNADVNSTDEGGYTTLHLASAEGCVEIVKILIENQANINQITLDNNTPLIEALTNHHLEPEVIKALMAAGADPDIKGIYTEFAWVIAAKKPDIMEAMLEGLAEGLSKMLLESDVLEQHVIVPGIVRIVNDYAAL